jgi:uncharacterized protein
MTEPSSAATGLLPEVTSDDKAFWTGGASGRLLIARCEDCGYWIHPPTPVCPICRGMAIEPHPVSGRGIVMSFSIVHYQWLPEPKAPYIVVLVELVEQEGLRLTSRLVGLDPHDVAIGTHVAVCFERVEDVWLPLFNPIAA